MAVKGRKELKAQMAMVFGEKIKVLSADLHEILLDDMVTAFENRLIMFEHAEGNLIREGETMNRSQLEIYVEILEVLDHCGPLKLTQVIYWANVNCSRLREELDFLAKQGLVEFKIIGKERKVYAITPLGVTVIKAFRELKEGLPVVEEHKDLVCSNAPIL